MVCSHLHIPQLLCLAMAVFSVSLSWGDWLFSSVSASWCLGTAVPAATILLLFLLGLLLQIFSGLSVKSVKFASPLLLVLDIH